MNIQIHRLAKAYYIAKSALIEDGFGDEMEWQYGVSLQTVDEPGFLREAAWVVMSSGLSEVVVRKKFPLVAVAFLMWRSAHAIATNSDQCVAEALRHFGHRAKIDAIATIAVHVSHCGFSNIIACIRRDGPTYLQQFPFLGPITSLHLAKNIGMPVAKPDRHMCRLATLVGYDDVQALCTDLSEITGEPVAVIDLVLWRFITHYRSSIDRIARIIDHTSTIRKGSSDLGALREIVTT